MSRASRLAAPALAVSFLAAAVAVSVGACGDDASVQRDCFARVWVPRGEGIRVAMARTGWEPTLLPVAYDEDWSLLRLELPAGEYGYSFVRGPKPEIDPRNPLTTFREDDGTEVSLLVVDDCDVPAIKIESQTVADGQIAIEGRFLAARSASPLDPKAIHAAVSTGDALDVEVVDAATGTFRARGAVGDERTTIAIDAADDAGVEAEPATVRVWPSRRATERRDEVLYQVVVDRFRGDGGAALAPPPTAGSRAGGTLDGVRAALEDGTFDRLGVTTLWLSPVYDNPDDARIGRDGRYYEGYHGYWVQNGRSVEPRIGGDDALRAVVAAAHARGIAILLDIVPNHVDETNPVRAEHEGDDWFNPPGCVCGTEECPWGPNLQICWFAPYLPDLHLQKPEVARYEADEARFWLTDFDVDGVRIDAVPMMPRASTRRIALALRQTVTAGEEPFIVGEVFTGPGAVALEEIRAQLGPDGLDSAFAFPLMWALRGAIASGGGSFEDVESLLVAEEERFAGSGVIVGRILDNHDVSRFVSVANGDDAGDPWDDPAEQPEGVEPYERMAVGLTAIFTLPGMPTIFQGDEVGLAGSNDPDNRRVMPADAALAPEQVALRAHTERLGALRRCSEALRRGDRRALVVDASHYAFARTTEEAAAIAVLSSQDSATTVEVQPPSAAGSWVDALTGDAFAPGASGTLAVDVPARGSRVLLPEGDRCLGEP